VVELVLIGLVAGFLAGISPCILPVLPVVLVASTAPESTGPATRTPRIGLARPLAVISGLVLSFSLLVLAGSELLSLLRLPQDSLRDAGIALLALVGLGYLIPSLGALLERPFARVRTRRPSRRAGGVRARPGAPRAVRAAGRRQGRLGPGRGPERAQPRPINGMVVAVMVRNCTLASSGSAAM
jgi:cytochrome c biogenesis protein CcdA